MPQSSELAELDRRIIAALQVDGRAAWRNIAEALGEAERTVARRGTALLRQGSVTVTGFNALRGEMTLARLRCSPGTVRVAAAAIANRTDTTFAYITTGTADCVAEFRCAPGRTTDLALDEIPGTRGLLSSSTLPALHYFRTVHEWQPGILTESESAALRGFSPNVPAATTEHVRIDRTDHLMLRALTDDGRRTHDELARLIGVSEATVRRRLEWLRNEGILLVRAVVEPALLGLPVEALLWVKTSPRHVHAVGTELLRSPNVRYCAALTGEHQLLVDVTTATRQALYDFINTESWLADADSVETSLVIDALKRSGVSTRR